MNFKRLISFAAIAFSAIASCKKSGSPTITNPTNPPINDGPDVYVSGTSIGANGVAIATYWKNGVAVTVNDNSTLSDANGIIIKGSDIYLFGNSLYPGTANEVATYWKNGVAHYLSAGVSSIHASAMALAGTDVYMAGNTKNATSNQVATYWKNGEPTSLQGNSLTSLADGVAVNGTDVYVSGIFEAPGYPPAATVWKNGIATRLTDSNTSAEAEAIAINGNDVYVAGYTQSTNFHAAPGTQMGSPIATLWKNGIANALTNSSQYAKANSIFINGTDVYVAGYIFSNFIYKPTYWKNGVATSLDASVFNDIVGYAGIVPEVTLTIDGTDVYVTAGYAGYWKNGVLVQLPQNSYARGIAVVSK